MKLKTVGAGCSPSDLGFTDDALISMKKMKRVLNVSVFVVTV